MTGRILIVEDETELAELVHMYLTNEGLEAEFTDRAEDALKRVGATEYDLIILDINLPGMDGFEFLQELRRTDQRTPVMILSAREADEDIVMGLGIGADEFVTKPFTPKVLTARVRSHLRRRRVAAEEGERRDIYRFGPFELDFHGYNLKRDGTIVQISTREFEVLRFLVRNAGQVFSSEEIFTSVWEQQFGDTMAIPVYIQRIRKKVEADYRNPQLIVTIHGRGYRFSPEVLQ